MDSAVPKAPRWLPVAFAGLALLAALAVAAWSVSLPYLAFSPGPVFDAIDNVMVEEDVQIYPPRGELMMLTVASQGLNAFEVLAVAIDPAVDLVRREAVRRPGESDEEYRERNLVLMDQSKENAVAVALSRVDQGLEIGSDGVEVRDVNEDAPAAEVLEPGDSIIGIEGVEVNLAQDIGEVIATRSPGDTVTLTVVRGGEERQLEVELTADPDDPDRPLVGILAATLNPEYPIDINSANVGGPSAGLMYTLAIVDLLTPGNLTNGRVVAGTGTIAADGTVGAVGGIRQKVVAAEAAGAEVILVPAGNYEAALTAERTTIEVVSVATIDEALDHLEGLPAA